MGNIENIEENMGVQGLGGGGVRSCWVPPEFPQYFRSYLGYMNTGKGRDDAAESCQQVRHAVRSCRSADLAIATA